MPRIFKRVKVKETPWDESHRKVLESGGGPVGLPTEFVGRAADENILKAWLALRDQIEAEWAKPGKRPWAWWAFDSQAPRDRDFDEGQQLDIMGELSASELAQLKATAVREDETLHANPHAAGGLPFRRSWAFWRFCHRRRPELSEAVQLHQMNILTPLEKAIKLEPRKAINGRLCQRRRFYYLSDAELSFLKLHAPMEFETCDL